SAARNCASASWPEAESPTAIIACGATAVIELMRLTVGSEATDAVTGAVIALGATRPFAIGPGTIGGCAGAPGTGMSAGVGRISYAAGPASVGALAGVGGVMSADATIPL